MAQVDKGLAQTIYRLDADIAKNAEAQKRRMAELVAERRALEEAAFAASRI